MIRRPPRSTPFPTRRSSDLDPAELEVGLAQRIGIDPGGTAKALGRIGIGPGRIGCTATSGVAGEPELPAGVLDRKSTRLNSSHGYISYAVFCLKKKKKMERS